MAAHQGLLIDAGGVLLTDPFASIDDLRGREGLGGPPFLDVYFGSPEVRDLFQRLERGEIDPEEVEAFLVRLLGLSDDRADGLFRRIYAGVRQVPEMIDAVERLRRAGVRTGLLSNSWWLPVYDDPFYERIFDVQLISGRLGVRKPHPRMFELGTEALGVDPERTVFVDDFEENLAPAAALGMTVVLHDPDRPAQTVERLEQLFG